MWARSASPAARRCTRVRRGAPSAPSRRAARTGAAARARAWRHRGWRVTRCAPVGHWGDGAVMSPCMLRSRSGTGASDSVRTMSRGRSVAISGYQWLSVAISGNQWQSVAISGNQVRTMSRGRRLPLIAHAGSLRRKRRACRSAIAWSKYSRRSASWICGRSTCEEGGHQRPSEAINGHRRRSAVAPPSLWLRGRRRVPRWGSCPPVKREAIRGN